MCNLFITMYNGCHIPLLRVHFHPVLVVQWLRSIHAEKGHMIHGMYNEWLPFLFLLAPNVSES